MLDLDEASQNKLFISLLRHFSSDWLPLICNRFENVGGAFVPEMTLLGISPLSCVI